MAEEKGQKAEDKTKKAEKKVATSMVAPHPVGRNKKNQEELKLVEDLAEEAGLKHWETAGLMRAACWAEGKKVSQGQFDATLTAFRSRPQGGGRIA